MKTRFYNANILDLSRPEGLILGELVIEDNLISYVGIKKQKGKFNREIDVKKNILMPGFIDAHTHSAMSLFRGVKDDATLHEWLFENILPMEDKLQSSDVYWGTKLAILEYLRSGITSIQDMYYWPAEIAKACSEMGLRANICIGAVSALEKNYEEKLTMFEKDVKKLNKIMGQDSKITALTSFHAIYTISKNDILKQLKYAKINNLRVATHLSETIKEVEDCKKENACTPTQYLEKLGYMDLPATFYHCVHMSKQDINILKKHNSSVVTCPSSNIKLASGIAPIQDFYEKDVPVAIGTDGPASNNSLDMFKEMFLVSGLTKMRENDPTVIPAKTVLEMATLGGAKALGIQNLGELKVGNLADIIIVDTTQPHFQPKNNLVSNLVYSAKSSDVIMTMVDGKILFEKDKKSLFNEQEIYKNCEKIIKRLQK